MDLYRRKGIPRTPEGGTTPRPPDQIPTGSMILLKDLILLRRIFPSLEGNYPRIINLSFLRINSFEELRFLKGI